MEFKAGALVKVRNRDWVVLPSNDENLVLLKPLGGSEDEVTGVYLPLAFENDQLESTSFAWPTEGDLGDISSARLLYNAIRLSFRNGAGPFRSLAKLSFRPRSYQIVPLIMALRQPSPIRLLIADDVGVGKTIEALLIIKELLERREINRFAIIALPHLCEQWQGELKDKFGIDAVIIRSNTQARLDREIQGDRSVYDYYPYQIISLDYIKSDQRRQIFIQEAPELVIVDEAHTCTKPTGANVTQQQRHHLIHDLAQKENQHLILLTATPHSGKAEQFSSLLGLLKKEYSLLDLPTATQSQRRDLAEHYVQRRRADVLKWMDEDTPFPKRDAGEYQYDLSPAYATFYENVLNFALGLIKGTDQKTGRARYRYWSALALLRGVMSSPATGLEMINKKIAGKETYLLDEADGLPDTETNPVMDEDYGAAKDFTPISVFEKIDWSTSENKQLANLAKQIQDLHGLEYDKKAVRAQEIISQWIKDGFNPVIFCRFIATANYLGEVLKPSLQKIHSDINVQVVTSEDPDEVRKNRIDDMESAKHRVLIATDCLSEGINLQDKFTAVLHYDLPWNPNRLEQREGRIDRFGQTAPIVKAYLLYGNNNPIDGVVLKVLLRKVREIRQATGISIPFPEDSQSLMDSVLQAVLFNAPTQTQSQQLTLQFNNADEVQQKELIATKAIEAAAARETASRNIFAQHAIKAHEIEQDLRQSDEAIGNPKAVEYFVTDALTHLLGAQITKDRKGYILFTANLSPVLKGTLPQAVQLKVSFYSPTPEGYLYIGRNHLFVEQLCRHLMAHSLKQDKHYGPARASVIRCHDVSIKTTLLLFRVRNVIEEKQTGKQLVAEEMLAWGYQGNAGDNQILSSDEIKNLMENAVPTSNLTDQAKEEFLTNELGIIKNLGATLDQIAIKRSEILVEAHERFRKVIGGKRYKMVEPVLPMDLMGIYILLPEKAKQ
jgi:superfamily II DNA or RNA helicase